MAIRKQSDADIRQQIPSARARALRKMREPWWPKTIGYVSDARAVEVGLRNHVTIQLPIKLFSELRGATAEQLEQVHLAGEAIRWDALDVDISFEGCLERAFGPQLFARTAGRIAGSVSTHKKSAAARTNGAKGGRPRKHRS
jgi:uncharacterized protein DUF2442